VKYCKDIFLFRQVKQRCEEIFMEVSIAYKFSISDIGFGRKGDHIHFIADIGLRSIPEIAKLLKGTSAKLLLREFPWLKEQYFWGSGLWSPVIYFDSVGQNYEEMSAYVNSQ
jgi:putative transposase